MARTVSLRVVAILAVLTSCRHAPANEVVLKNGIVLKGRTQRVQKLTTDQGQAGNGRSGRYLLIDERFRRYYVPYRLVASDEPDGGIERRESFRLKHIVSSRKTVPDWIGAFADETQFDEFGVRRVTLSTPAGRSTIVQAIREINPDYVWLQSLTHRWECGMATTSIPAQVLDRILMSAVKLNDPHERLAVCRFYIDAEQFGLADRWLTGLREQFPEFRERCDAVALDLRQAQAERLLQELRQRAQAGQHALVQQALQQFPRTNLQARVREEVNQMQAGYRDRAETAVRVNMLLGDLEAELAPELAELVRPMRGDVADGLSHESLSRLDAFLNLVEDNTLDAGQKLAVAYSGWLLGSANAITNLQETAGLWDARLLILDYLSSNDPFARRKAVGEIKRLEGVSPARVVQLLALLPPSGKNVPRASQITEMNVPAEEGVGSAVRYKVVLPQNYSPWHEYPMVVTLRREDRTLDEQLEWWGAQAVRRGYVVIAPEYLHGTAYEFTADSHRAVVGSIRDALRRFNVDPDRVFLSGHGAGGDAAFDIAMAHPGLFAGVIPITGLTGRVCNRCWENAVDLPWYVIHGERHRSSLFHNSLVLSRLTLPNPDVTVCEYVGRGFESYYAEIHNLFDWMDFHRRPALPTDFTVNIVRPEDTSFFWVETSDFPEVLPDDQDFLDDKASLKSVEMQVRVTSANVVEVRRGGAKHVLRLMDGPIDLSRPIVIRDGSRRKRIFAEPRIADVLEDFRIYRDRKRVALQRLSL